MIGDADYHAVLADLKQRRESQIGDIVKLPESGDWGLAEWYPRSPSQARKPRRTGSNKTHDPARQGDLPSKPISMIDAAEKILREAGTPLHASELVEKLK